nr:protein kinase-like domain, concanavalin A-like lectin/glucanase domain protein [Tanacetum cinerariifolium]
MGDVNPIRTLGDYSKPSHEGYMNTIELPVGNNVDAKLSKFEANFKQQQSKMTNKIDTVLKAITDRIAGALPSNTVKDPKLNVNSTSSFVCSFLPINRSPMLNPNPRFDQHHRNPSKKNGYEYRGRIFIGLGRNMHVLNMSYVMDFTILENIKTNTDPTLSHVVFGRPFVEIACLAINRKHGLITFMDGTKEIIFKTPYKDPEMSESSSEGNDLLSSRIILSEDGYDRGCRKPSDLKDGFYRDTFKLGLEYVSGIDDEGQVT